MPGFLSFAPYSVYSGAGLRRISKRDHFSRWAGPKLHTLLKNKKKTIGIPNTPKNIVGNCPNQDVYILDKSQVKGCPKYEKGP